MVKRKSAAPEPPPVTESDGNLPVHSIRQRNLKAAIWRNETENGVIYNVALSRSYRQDNVWHDTQSFSYIDLMNLVKLLFDTHTFITNLRLKDTQRENPSAPSRSASP